MDQIAQSAAPSSHLGQDKELQWCSFLFQTFPNHICHSWRQKGLCFVRGWWVWIAERIALEFTVCDTGLSVIFFELTPLHERCHCNALRD